MGLLAKGHGVSGGAVRAAVLGITWRHISVRPIQRANVGGWTVLTAMDEAEIVRHRSLTPPEPYREIAQDLGHDVATVCRAWHRLR